MNFPALPSRARLVLPAILLFSALLGAAGLGLAFAPTRVGYQVEPDAVVVSASLGPLDQTRRFERSIVRDPRVVTLKGGRRRAGTGKPGYCEGSWSYPDLGAVWQATSCVATGVVFDAGEERIVVSPADPEGMVRALSEPGASGEFVAATASEGSRGWMLLLLLPLLGLAALPWIGWRVSRPMVYQIADGALIVPAHFSPVTVRLRGARFTRRPLGRAWKVAGSAIPGMYLGTFREGGASLHIAATDSKRGVLVEGARRVYVTPADLDRFIQVLREEGAAEV